MAQENSKGPTQLLNRTFEAIVPDSLDDVSYLTRTDIRIIARELGINLYEYFASTNKRPARWRFNQETRRLLTVAECISRLPLKMGVVVRY